MTPRRLLRFAIGGTLGYVADAGTLEALVRLAGLGPYLARVISFLVAASVTWWFNRRFTFEVRHASSAGEWGRYVALMLLGAAVNYGGYAAALAWWPLAREHLWLAVALGSGMAMGINYASMNWLFRGIKK